VFAKPLGSEFSFVKNTGSASWMKTFRNGTLFVTALRIGLTFPLEQSLSTGDDNTPDPRVPISERYFAGGESTVRGFALDELGPTTPDGQPTGGNALLIANQEFRFPIYRQFRGVLFYDVGNVYPRVQDFDPMEVRNVFGVGLRFDMPLGPLRLEYGRKLDREPGETSGELFFAIGAAF
jgi:outer membrane translocation and assembly module TamA